MTADAFAPARAARRPRRWFLSGRALTGAFLFGATLLAGLVMFRPSHTQAVLVVTHNLAAGDVLGRDDVRVSDVRLEGSTYRAVVPAGELGRVVGKTIAEPAREGELLSRASVSGGRGVGPGQVAVALVPDADKGRVAGVQPGDLVQVFVTRAPSDNASTRTEVVLRSAHVYDVGYPEGAEEADSPAEWLSLAVSEEDALRLVGALRSGDVDVALLPAGGSR